MKMKKLFVLAGILILAGTAHAQYGGSLNNGGTINGSGNLNSSTGMNNSKSINGDSGKTASSPNSPDGVRDASVNSSSKNPGLFVPSTYSSYREAVTLGLMEGQIRPLTVAEAARLSQQQKKAAKQKPAIVLEQDTNGKLMIATEKNRAAESSQQPR
jgi:hypothetical protein